MATAIARMRRVLEEPYLDISGDKTSGRSNPPAALPAWMYRVYLTCVLM
jgi:hypothetical protein